MELKTPTKKGIKTPRDRPPLPMLNESYSGFCVDEYDWPLFTGYYNGTSVIVDDSQAMTLLTNKGFFGKGSLSKGCPNLAKRKIPISVVYESQWKRRKTWIQSLNTLLESNKRSKETSDGSVVDIDNKESNDVEKMEADSESSVQNNSCKTEQKSSEMSENEHNQNNQNKANETSEDNVVSEVVCEDNSNKLEKKEIDTEKTSPPQHNSCKVEEDPSKTSGNEDIEESKINCNETSQNNMVDIDSKKSNGVEKMEVDNEKNTLNELCKTEEEPSKTSGNGDNQESKNNFNESSQDNVVEIDEKKGDDVENKEVDNDKNNPQNKSCKTEEESSKTSENEGNGDGKVSLDPDDTKQITKEPEGQKERNHCDKNEEIINIPLNDTQIENKLKDKKINDSYGTTEELNSSKVIDNQSTCSGKINLSNNTEKGTLNINEVLVIPDIDGELEQYFLNLKPTIEEETVKTAIEVLYLSLEEAFFLSYACNCLQIFDLTSNILPIRDMWILFQESQPNFIENYVAYHYFRAKGWVVKSGTKFGGDFLLYKKGPLYFHASYIVIVEVLKNDKNSRNKTTWQKIVGINRMAESANKEILICHVLWPDVKEEKFNDPGILKEFRVSEMLVRRWQATQEKTP